jgi:hypothetical protein
VLTASRSDHPVTVVYDSLQDLHDPILDGPGDPLDSRKSTGVGEQYRDPIESGLLLAATAAGLLLGPSVAILIAGRAYLWLGFGIGGAICSGFAHYLYSKRHANRQHHTSWVRIVSLFLLLGLYGQTAASLFGRVGEVIAFFVIPLLLACGARIARILR